VLGVAVRVEAACLRFASLMSVRALDRSLLSLANLADDGSVADVEGIVLEYRSYAGFALFCDVERADCTTIKGSLRILLASSLRLSSHPNQVQAMNTRVWRNDMLRCLDSLSTLPLALRILVLALLLVTFKLSVGIPRLGLPFWSIQVHGGRIVILDLIRGRFRLVEYDCTGYRGRLPWGK
jgi:hypothetical protein